uniref:Uncharacterized protein n=1 Tax=Manihot esculenta TaxID=3983 RepID=A0A2C9V2J0_MANES
MTMQRKNKNHERSKDLTNLQLNYRIHNGFFLGFIEYFIVFTVSNTYVCSSQLVIAGCLVYTRGHG